MLAVVNVSWAEVDLTPSAGLSHRNGIALSGVSAVNGQTLSGLSAINGQAIA
jgi:hypothetical protein